MEKRRRNRRKLNHFYHRLMTNYNIHGMINYNIRDSPRNAQRYWRPHFQVPKQRRWGRRSGGGGGGGGGGKGDPAPKQTREAPPPYSPLPMTVKAPDIQVQTPDIQVQTPKIQVQTPRIQVKDPKNRFRPYIYIYIYIYM